MQVKLTISRAGARVSQSAGEIVEVGEEEGARMIEAGQAEAVSAKGKETATKKTSPEKATKE